VVAVEEYPPTLFLPLYTTNQQIKMKDPNDFFSIK
jgi:hypothetical protein